MRAAQGRQEEAESLLRESLAILEPTMYTRFAEEVRASLDAMSSPRTARAAAASRSYAAAARRLIWSMQTVAARIRTSSWPGSISMP